MTIEEALKLMLNSGPGYALVVAVLVIARQAWCWLWNDEIDAQTGQKKGPAAQWLVEYQLTQQELRHSIKTTAETTAAISNLVAGGRIFDEKHSISLEKIEQSISNIEQQLSTVDKSSQSVSTQRVLKMLISTMLEMAASAGIDTAQHRSKFMAFLQDAA